MSYYRRKSRGKGLRFKFQSYVDLATSASSMQVIQWSVGGSEVINRCRHLIGAYKYMKLGKISVKLVPASTLPVDPLQLSYDPSDPQAVDPRDQMNPGLVRITNGEDLFTDVSSLSDAQQEGMYKTMMLDPRWSKFMLQSGFRRTAVPLYWQVGQLHQDKYPGSTINVPIVGDVGQGITVDPSVRAEHILSGVQTEISDTNFAFRGDAGSSARGLFQVGHRGRLGFLPTDYFQDIPTVHGIDSARFSTKSGINNVPEVQVITCVLPKAYKTLYYYRCFITEEVIFAGLRSSPIDYMGIDNFVYANPTPMFVSKTPIQQGNATPGTYNNGDELP